MTELSFLIDLLINPRDSEQLKKDLAARIKEVEANISSAPMQRAALKHMLPPPPTLQQAPSTLAAMAKHGDIPNFPGSAQEFQGSIPAAPMPVVLNDGEVQARQNSMEILKRKKQQQLRT